MLTGVALTGDHSVLWDGRDNNAAPFPAGSYDFRITGRNGEIHFPMVDVERNPNGGPSLVKLNGPSTGDDTVYYDDRGYRTASGVAIGELNGHLCGATSNNEQPNPTHSLLGISSSTPYRSWNAGGNLNNDCGNNGNFGDAKALDLWSFEKTPPIQSPITIVEQPVEVDVGTAVSVTPSVLPGQSAYGQFSFYNASSSLAIGVTYSATIGNLSAGTCPAAVQFTSVPTGVTAVYSASTCAVTFTGMPDSLTSDDQLVFGFNYVVAIGNPGPIPVTTQISASNEDADVAPNTATAQTVVATPEVSVVKRATPGTGSSLTVGQSVNYSVAVTVANAPLTAAFSFSDSPGTGLAFGAITNAPAAFSCSGALVCSLPVGTPIGTYTVSYTAIVQNSAGDSVNNQVQITGNGGDVDPVCGTCSLTHTVLHPEVAVSKSATPDANTAVNIGQSLSYTVTVAVSNAPLSAEFAFNDTPGTGLEFGSITNADAAFNCTGALACSLPAGTPIGNYTVTYAATVVESAGASVSNQVAITSGGGDEDPVCSSCTVTHNVDKPVVAVAKTATPGADALVGVGQTVSYAVTVTVSNAPLTDTDRKSVV